VCVHGHCRHCRHAMIQARPAQGAGAQSSGDLATDASGQ
jgi:hypothetical protein